MNVFLDELSKAFPKDYIVLAADGARWHSSGGLVIPSNIEIITLPPYTPEMNPIEQIWREFRTNGFKNVLFQTLAKLEDKLCDSVKTNSHYPKEGYT